MQQSFQEMLEKQSFMRTVESIENLLWLIAGLLLVLVVTQVYRIWRESRAARRPADWPTRVEAAYEKGDYDEALEILDSTELIYPASAWIHYWRGRCYFQLERWDDAARTFEDLLRRDPAFRRSVRDYLVFIEVNELVEGIEGYAGPGP